MTRDLRGSSRLLVVSHACSTAINQQIYAELERLTGWDVTLIVPQRWKDEFGRRLDEPAWPEFRGRILRAPVVGNGSIILHFYRFPWMRFLKAGDFDAIYVNHEPYALATAQVVFASRRAGRVPIGFYSCQNIEKTYRPPFRWLERMVYRSSKYALPITTDVAGVLRAKGFAGDLTVCPLPFDPHLYHPRPSGEWPPSLQRAHDVPLIGFVGRLVEAKGLRTLAVALGRITDLPWRLAIVGSGPFEPEFRRLLEQQGISDRSVHFGFVPHQETPAYLSAMDVLVLPSETQPGWKEQFGRVIPEALASGAAVIGSDSGEIPNLIRTSGGGRVFPERDAAALAGELRYLLTDVVARQAHATAGGAWALKNITLGPVARTMAGALKEAMQEGQNGQC